MSEKVEGADSSVSKSMDSALKTLEEKLSGGLHFLNMLGYSNQDKIAENKALVNVLVDLLIDKGILDLSEVEQCLEKISKTRTESTTKGAQVRLVDTTDKYAQKSASDVDCASRIQICKGVCCKFWFTLSVQDVKEKIVKWNYSQPFNVAQDDEGRCVHHDRCTFRCTIYDNRPLVCLSYDCRRDDRIWLDYDDMVINPDVLEENML